MTFLIYFLLFAFSPLYSMQFNDDSLEMCIPHLSQNEQNEAELTAILDANAFASLYRIIEIFRTHLPDKKDVWVSKKKQVLIADLQQLSVLLPSRLKPVKNFIETFLIKSLQAIQNNDNQKNEQAIFIKEHKVRFLLTCKTLYQLIYLNYLIRQDDTLCCQNVIATLQKILHPALKITTRAAHHTHFLKTFYAAILSLVKEALTEPLFSQNITVSNLLQKIPTIQKECEILDDTRGCNLLSDKIWIALLNIKSL